MNRLSTDKQALVLKVLLEGSSIRSTVRITGVAKNTIGKLLADVGRACHAYQEDNLTNLTCKRIQCDEIWSFCGQKEKSLPENLKGAITVGHSWTWVAICADTRLVPCWIVGKRIEPFAILLLRSLSRKVKGRFQLTTDGLSTYIDPVWHFFADRIDYAMLVKQYGTNDSGKKQVYTGAKVETIFGDPDPEHISTSYCERQNLTMRMRMRRFTRKTNGFSKKFENHQHAVALHFMHYNFVAIHQTLKTTPAVAAGIALRPFSIDDIVDIARDPQYTSPRPSMLVEFGGQYGCEDPRFNEFMHVG